MSIADVLAGRALWTVAQGDCLELLRSMPDACIHTVVCSPPYYGLRSYGLPPTVWPGADPDCAHEWQETTRAGQSGGNGASSGLNCKRAPDGTFAPDSHAHGADKRFSMVTTATCTRCNATRCCLGLESVPDCGRPGGVVCNRCFCCHLVVIFREVRRVMRSDACLFLNMGDSYAGSWGNQGRKPERGTQRPINGPMMQAVDDGRYPSISSNAGAVPPGLKPKDLMMMPARVALALQADGWWIRSAITWCKRAPMPESVTDRPTSATEMVYLLTKAPSYFYDADAVREPHVRLWDAETNGGSMATMRHHDAHIGGTERHTRPYPEPNPNGANLKNFWLLGPEPSDARYCAGCGSLFEGPSAGRVRTHWHTDGRVEHVCPGCGASDRWVSHFAAYPTELVKRCVLAGTSERGVCPRCGSPYRRVVEKGKLVRDDGSKVRLVNPIKRDTSLSAWSRPGGKVETVVPNAHRETTTTGWRAGCACQAGQPIPAVVLDIFSGSGQTALASTRLGRRAIGLELSEDYAALSRKRLAGVMEPLFHAPTAADR